jgi:hypothetical protein
MIKLLNKEQIMSVVTKIETTVAGWLKSVPHLPKGGQKWIAENVWWIAMIGMIASIIGIFTAISALVVVATFAPSVDYYGYAIAQTYNGPTWISLVLSLVVSIIQITLLAMAIKPLRSLQKRGWTLLFLTLLLNAVSIVLSAVFSFNPLSFVFGLIFGAIGLAIGAYFTFEIRSYFVHVAPVAAKTTESK